MKKISAQRSVALVIFLFFLFVAAFDSYAKVYKLLVVDSQQSYPYVGTRDSMFKHLASLGFVEGKNLIVKRFSIGNDAKKAEEIFRRELPNNYDAILSNGTVVTVAAKRAALGKQQYRFIFAAVTDPVGVGVIKDFINPPFANFTGVCYPAPVTSRMKFVRDVMPEALTIGLIYADMPQSHSYRKWVERALQEEPLFRDMKVIFRMVPLVTGDIEGQNKMAELAKKYILALDPLVDVFLSPNDQLGAGKPFPKMVYQTATKPLVGLGLAEIMEEGGATMSLYPSDISSGRQCAVMIKRLFEGEDISKIIPQWPKENGIAFDLRKAKKFGIKIPIQMLEMAGDNIVR